MKYFLIIILLYISSSANDSTLVFAAFEKESKAITAKEYLKVLLKDQINFDNLFVIKKEDLYQIVLKNIPDKNKKDNIEKIAKERYFKFLKVNKKFNKEDNLLEQAIFYFNNKEYKKAHNLLITLNKTFSKNPKFNFYLARSFFELGNFNKAMKLYKFILTSNEKDIRVRLELARTYYELSKFELSKKEFNTVLKQKLPNNVKENVKQYLKQIKNI